MTERAPTISVVIPVLDEAGRIGRQLGSLVSAEGFHEVIVVDGGSTDGTRDEVATFADTILLSAPRGRGPQLNAGAHHASGDVLLFLHADVLLPTDAARLIRETLGSPKIIAGAFPTRTVLDPTDKRQWIGPLLALADIRSRVARAPYGDQALFVRRAPFEAMGGFREIPLMEDLEFSRRLLREGVIGRAPAAVQVSGRRFAAQPLRSLVMMNLFPLLFRAGISPFSLARLYGVVR